MKKIFFLMLVFSLVLGTAGFANISQAVEVAQVTNTTLDGGKLIKGETNPTIYYLAEDGKRYVFPNANTYFSWYDDFSEVTQITDEELFSYPLGGNVRYKPGSLLVKIQTDPKVYAVSNNGVLRWIKTEALARSLYGNFWNKLIDDVPDSFFTNYTVGDAVETEDDYSPTEEEETTPDISTNYGFRAKKQIQNRINNRLELYCVRLENATNRLQKRLANWGMKLDGVGDDFVSECVEKNIARYNNQKANVCHVDAEGNSITLNVGPTAVKAHLAHGDVIGECTDDTSNNTTDDTSDDTSNNTDDTGTSTDDVTAPAITDVSATPAGLSATIIWTTDEDADSKIYYAAESLDTATNILEVEDSTLTTSHSLEVTNLSTSTMYYFKVESKDAATNSSESSEDSFTTLSE